MTTISLKRPDHTDSVWSADDRDWFVQNPNRSWRLRKPKPGEVEALAAAAGGVCSLFQREVSQRHMTLAIAVHQARVGVRVRQLVATTAEDSLSSFTDAGIVRMLPGLLPALVRCFAQVTEAGHDRPIDRRPHRPT
jgi:hypothetical protein